MTKPIYGRFTYGTKIILLPLCSSTTYEELLAKVSSRIQYLGGRFVFTYALTDCSNCHLECDDDISVMLDIFPMLNSPFIDIHVLDIGCSSKSYIDEEILVVVKPATISNVFEDVPQHVAEANLSSDDSNYKDVDNMVIGRGSICLVNGASISCYVGSISLILAVLVILLCSLPLLENLPEDQRQGGLGLLVKRPDQCNANAVINLATTTAGHALQLYEQWHM
uniref:uncharacterized protein LOC105352022 n=1 Tax=Fragaria vesca subsp. vesca TaxID=101020 RepID=UPI0005C9A9A4|nr:PREDICTED: uncharacterized protein LOC105352022 [Fragaria vesca subsp. vesca]